ncbi:hypothetical protein GDO86_001513 [Hymenochirus boettgeri]|uniref:Uncharacterized protein n=1 Tax=Hymenochirus boettgeri TaxID=247094 RepID=A0A8T2KDZ1_9PIPI|nr:hypothetical protein GDO86_001513 [Hymenochirus boettgeri]
MLPLGKPIILFNLPNILIKRHKISNQLLFEFEAAAHSFTFTPVLVKRANIIFSDEKSFFLFGTGEVSMLNVDSDWVFKFVLGFLFCPGIFLNAMFLTVYFNVYILSAVLNISVYKNAIFIYFTYLMSVK